MLTSQSPYLEDFVEEPYVSSCVVSKQINCSSLYSGHVVLTGEVVYSVVFLMGT